MDDATVLHLRLAPGAPAEAAGAAVRSVAIHLGVDPARTTRLRVVVEELVAEAMAREDVGEAGEVVVDGHFDGSVLRLDVTDQRLPVDPAEARSLRSRRLVALGFVDRLRVASHGKAGNVAECEVRVHEEGEHGPHVDGSDDSDGDAAVGRLADDAPTVSDEVAESVEVRRMEPGDAFGLIRCLYRCYGYTYKEPAMYQRRAVERMLRTGSMTSVVAVLPDGEVVGHSAYLFERAGDRVPEAGRLVVDPRFRGRHLAERMAHERGELAVEAGVPGVWAECVANHPASQLMVLKAGGAEIGLLIGASPGGVMMTGLTNDNAGRRTLVATFTPAAESEPLTIHVRERHADLFTELADRLDLARTVVPVEDSVTPTGRSRLQVTVNPGAGTADIRVVRCGSDLLAKVAAELEALLPNELGATYVDVSLAGESGAWAVEQLERLQFCWAAWVPDFDADGDVLRLQRVGDHAVDLEHVVCARPEGEALRDHVISEWRRVQRAAIA